jgi:hypothetical protein
MSEGFLRCPAITIDEGLTIKACKISFRAYVPEKPTTEVPVKVPATITLKPVGGEPFTGGQTRGGSF